MVGGGLLHHHILPGYSPLIGAVAHCAVSADREEDEKPIMTTLGEIVMALLEISPWPWVTAPGNFITTVDRAGEPDQIVSEVPCQGGNDKDLDFITSSPRWLAELVVRLMQERANVYAPGPASGRDGQIRMALRDFDITPKQWAELKWRLWK